MQCFLESCTLPRKPNYPRRRYERSLETVGLRFEISIFEYLHEKDPRAIGIMAALAELYTRDFHSVTWDGRDDYGQQIGSGVYVYRLQVGNTVLTRKMVLMK